jgi:hypothetical protein
MSVSTFTGTTLYRNVRSGQVAMLLNQQDDRTLIATVKEDGETGRTRTVPTSLIHQSDLDPKNKPHTQGYVPLNATPAQRPTSPDRNDMDLMDNLDVLSDVELAELIHRNERIKKEAGDIAERAKAVAKARRGGNLGLAIHGDLALVYGSGAKFDAKTAAMNLSPVDFQRILLPKPDATMARKIFANEPGKLELCLKDSGPSLTVREATDEDRAKIAASAPVNDEDFVIRS